MVKKSCTPKWQDGLSSKTCLMLAIRNWHEYRTLILYPDTKSCSLDVIDEFLNAVHYRENDRGRRADNKDNDQEFLTGTNPTDSECFVQKENELAAVHRAHRDEREILCPIVLVGNPYRHSDRRPEYEYHEGHRLEIKDYLTPPKFVRRRPWRKHRNGYHAAYGGNKCQYRNELPVDDAPPDFIPIAAVKFLCKTPWQKLRVIVQNAIAPLGREERHSEKEHTNHERNHCEEIASEYQTEPFGGRCGHKRKPVH